jgi:uncharacterized membrane protein
MVIVMSDEKYLKKVYSAIIRQEFPADLTFVIIWLAVSIVAIYLPILNETIMKVVFALPVVLFIPGYCFISALFPKNDDISFMERIALSVGLSVVIISLIGLGLNFTIWGIQLDPLVIFLALFSWIMIFIAYIRRAILPSEEQFRVQFSGIIVTIREGFDSTENSKINQILKTVLAIVIFAAILSTIYTLTFPKEEEHFTEFFILGKNHIAADYPNKIIIGQRYPIYIGIGNNEYRNITYTTEIWIMQMEFDNVTNTSTIKIMDLLDRQSQTLEQNETIIVPYNLSVKKNEYNRVEFLLFKDTIPGPDLTGSDRINKSYRDLHQWITVL